MWVMVLGSAGKSVGKWAREGKEVNRVCLNEQVIAVGIWGPQGKGMELWPC